MFIALISDVFNITSFKFLEWKTELQIYTYFVINNKHSNTLNSRSGLQKDYLYTWLHTSITFSLFYPCISHPSTVLTITISLFWKPRLYFSKSILEKHDTFLMPHSILSVLFLSSYHCRRLSRYSSIIMKRNEVFLQCLSSLFRELAIPPPPHIYSKRSMELNYISIYLFWEKLYSSYSVFLGSMENIGSYV